MMNQPSRQPADSRFRGLVILWGAQVFSLGLLFAVMQLVRPASPADTNQTLTAVLEAFGLVVIGTSFALKSLLLGRAAAQQRPDLVTSGYTVAFALCEACALFGLVARFVTGTRGAIYFFGLSLVAFLLHFPRRQHVEAAMGDQGQAFKTSL